MDTSICTKSLIIINLFQILYGLKEYDWRITRGYLAPDCVEKLMLTVNGEFPGPEIRLLPNEEVIIRVYNQLPTESITIHWHGQHQIGTPFMDGISNISQCPIAPYSSFTYRFFANSEPGTYFYHIHSGALIEGGAYGAFIIINSQRDNQYDGEFTMLIADNYHRETYHSIFNLLSADNNTFRWVFDPNSILINGKGIYDCYDNDDYYCDYNQTINEMTYYHVIKVMIYKFVVHNKEIIHDLIYMDQVDVI